MADELAVFLSGIRMGAVVRSPGGRYGLDYADDYRRTGRIPLSPTLPIGPGPFKSEHIDAYLEGLLPEKPAVREQWAIELGTTDHAFALLTAMGRDCVGSVQFTPPNQVSDLLARPSDYKLQSMREIGDRLRGLRESGASWTLPDEHWSLPGAQDKFTLTRLGGAWHKHEGAGPSTHIVKPGVHQLHHQAALEHATMRVAERLGLRVAATQMQDFDGETAVVVRRFDRIIRPDNTIHRLHQVDFCQAMGRHPKNKYEERGGPRTESLATLLWNESALPEVDVRRFSDAVLFNYIVGAPDGHSKNFALLYAPDGRARMAPLYDLSSAFAYEPNKNGYDLSKTAMSIGGRRKFGEVLHKHLDRHAREMRLDPSEVRDRTASLADAAPEAFYEVLLELGKPGKEIEERLLPRLTKHTRDFAARIHTGKPAPTRIPTGTSGRRTPKASGSSDQSRDARGRFGPMVEQPPHEP